MPSIYKRRTLELLKRPPRRNIPINIVKTALEDVQSRKKSLRGAAEYYDIPKSTLCRYLKNNRIPSEQLQNFSSVHVSRQIFTLQEEELLVSYLIHAAQIHYGLTKKQTKTLAFEFAVANTKTIPDNWRKSRIASEDWYAGFRNRNPQLSLRKPEATSLSRATSFNKKNVGEYFEKVASVYQKYNFPPSSVYNIDETGVTTVQVPSKILAPKGAKQIGKITSAERGTLVTVCCGINAVGNTIPTFFIFPRVNFKDYMLKNAPNGSAGAAHPSGWMTVDNFKKYMTHFIAYAKPSVEHPVLLFYDNHDSHISLDVINAAKENGVVIITLPPHCSNKLQPLDVGVYGPFKKFYNSAVDTFMVNNPGKTVTIYDIAELVNEAFLRAFTPSNIVASFTKTGIYPYNPHVFKDEDFLCSSVTNREQEPTETDTVQATHCSSSSVLNDGLYSTPILVSPEIVRPFPKAPPRKRPNFGRKPAKSRILTETPEKNDIAKAEDRKNRRFAQKKVKKRMLVSSSSESSVDECNEDGKDSDKENVPAEDEQIQEDDFIVVKFHIPTKSVNAHYIGKVIKLQKAGFLVSFLRRHGVTNRFYYPHLEDKQIIQKQQIVKKLSKPSSTNKRETFLIFKIHDLRMPDLR